MRIYKKASNRANKKLDKLLHKLNKEHYSTKIQMSKNKCKTMWDIIKSHKSKTNEPLIKKILVDNNSLVDPLAIANAFNCYFSKIIKGFPNSIDIVKSLDILTSCFERQIPRPKPTFFFAKINLLDLQFALKDLKISKSNKFGDIPTTVITEYLDIIGPTLLRLVNACLRKGCSLTYLK